MMFRPLFKSSLRFLRSFLFGAFVTALACLLGIMTFATYSAVTDTSNILSIGSLVFVEIEMTTESASMATGPGILLTILIMGLINAVSMELIHRASKLN